MIQLFLPDIDCHGREYAQHRQETLEGPEVSLLNPSHAIAAKTI